MKNKKMKSALIFLNGYYDTRHLDFYRQEMGTAVENGSPLICADGGIRIFDELNRCGGLPLVPDVLIGDMDSGPNRGDKSLPTSKTDRPRVGWEDRQRLHRWAARCGLRVGSIRMPTYHHLWRVTASGSIRNRPVSWQLKTDAFWTLSRVQR